jgi:hypothetical protein
MIRNLITLPYELARKPLALADERLSGKLPDALAQRFGKALGTADALAGTVLRKPEITERGVDRVDRATRLLQADRLEREADAQQAHARETAQRGAQEAARKREAARERAADGLDEADKIEARSKQEAKERAEKTAASKKAAADKRASTKKTAAERRKAQVTSVANATQQGAQRRAKAELDEARDDMQSAAEARADAQRLSDLTNATKRDRKQD